MDKKILQTVSGEYDNTYLLIKNLQAGDNVYPLYIHVSFINSIKQKIEYEIVKNLIRKLKKKYKKLHDLTETEIYMEPIPYLFSTQPITWILGLLKEVKEKQQSVGYDEAHIGYVKNDCAIGHLPQITTLWKHFFTFSDGIRPFKMPKLCFPLAKYGKKKIIEELKLYDKNILASCWTCEKPKILKTLSNRKSIEVNIAACGSCRPCIALRRIDLDTFYKIKKYKTTVDINYYRNIFNTNLKEIIKENKINYIPNKYISLKYANKKLTSKNAITKKKMNKLIK